MQQTSINAFESIFEELGSRQLEVYHALIEIGPANNLMISKRLNIPINSITPRMKELRDLKKVGVAYVKECPITKRKSIFWKIL